MVITENFCSKGCRKASPKGFPNFYKYFNQSWNGSELTFVLLWLADIFIERRNFSSSFRQIVVRKYDQAQALRVHLFSEGALSSLSIIINQAFYIIYPTRRFSYNYFWIAMFLFTVNWCEGHQCRSTYLVVRLPNVRSKSGKKCICQLKTYYETEIPSLKHIYLHAVHLA